MVVMFVCVCVCVCARARVCVATTTQSLSVCFHPLILVLSCGEFDSKHDKFSQPRHNLGPVLIESVLKICRQNLSKIKLCDWPNKLDTTSRQVLNTTESVGSIDSN